MNIIEVLDPGLIRRLLRPDPSRSPGLHLSTVLADINRRLEPGRFGGPLPPGRIGLGLAFELLLGPAVRKVMNAQGERPGEFRSNGIIMTPDWMADCLEEWKWTWMTMRTDKESPLYEDRFQHWHRQGKSYCHALGTRLMRFRVGFVNGDYAPPNPDLRTFEVHYTDREIRDNWDMVVQHAKDMGVI